MDNQQKLDKLTGRNARSVAIRESRHTTKEKPMANMELSDTQQTTVRCAIKAQIHQRRVDLQLRPDWTYAKERLTELEELYQLFLEGDIEVSLPQAKAISLYEREDEEVLANNEALRQAEDIR